MNVFDLFATLSLDASQYEEGLDGAEKKGSSFGSKLKSGIGTASKVAGAALATTAVAAVGTAKAFISGAGDVAVYGDHIDKMSQKLNMSAESYQEWDFIMQHAGTSIDSMQASIKTLSNAAENNNKAFGELGITQKDIASMSGEELFGATLSALQNVEDETKRTYLAGQLLGRGATELGPLLNMSAEEVEDMKKQVHDLGGVMSDDAVKASAQYQDSLQNMHTSMSGFKNTMMSEFLPSMSTVMDGLANVFSGNDVESGMQQIENGVNELVDNLSQQMPRFLELGGKILMAIVDSLVDNLPMLLEAGGNVLEQLLQGIIEALPKLVPAIMTFIKTISNVLLNNLPSLVKAGMDIITALLQGIANGEVNIVGIIVEVIQTISNTLLNPSNLMPIIQAAIQIIEALVQGILEALPVLIEFLPTIIENIITVFTEALPLFLDMAVQVFMQLVEAIPIVIEALLEALPTIIDTVVTALVNALPLIINAAIQMFMGIVNAIPKIIQTLVKNLPSIISTITSTLIKNLPQVLAAAFELFMGIVKAIPQIIVELVANIPSIISAIVSGLGEGFSQIFEVGKNLIQGLWNGIKSVTGWIKDKIKGFASNIVGGIKSFFGISSPSKLFRDQIGKNLAYGIGVGFEDGLDKTLDGMESAAGSMASDIADSMQAPFESLSLDAGTVSMKGKSYSEQRDQMVNDVMRMATDIIGKMVFEVPVYIGTKKFDQQVVSATARANVISGGR